MGLSCSKILLTFLLVCTLMPSNIFADYDLRKDKKKQILNYKNDVEKLQKEIRENEILADQYRTEIDDLASQLKLLTKFIGDVESNGLEDKDSLLMSEIEINKIKEKLDPLRENFKKRLYGSISTAGIMKAKCSFHRDRLMTCTVAWFTSIRYRV